MAEPENFILVYLRRIDEKLDRVIEDLQDLKVRVTALEERLAHVEIAIVTNELSIAGINRPIDRVELRLDLADAPH